MQYHLVQLGCQMNRSDAERLSTVLEALGYTACEREEEAQILGVVACSVRQKAIDRVYARISKWNDWKRHRPILTLLSGCVLDEDREKFLDRFDLVFAIAELEQLPDMISQYGVVMPRSRKSGRDLPLPVWLRADPDDTGNLPAIPGLSRKLAAEQGKEATYRALRQSTLDSIRQLQTTIQEQGGAGTIREHLPRIGGPEPLPQAAGTTGHTTGHTTAAQASLPAGVDSFWQIQPTHSSAFEAWVPIQNGCDKFCTYCAVPYTRGREVSRDGDEILAELQSLVDRGFKSITLLGQNVNSWGLDKPAEGRNFAWLLEQTGQLGRRSGKRFWVSFTSPHPRDMSREVIEVIARHDCLAKQIHLPLQSGDDAVLERMNRRHNLARYREIMGWIRELIPQATVFTDIIVGFTGETEAEFDHTRQAMAEFGYQMAFIAQYSPRPGAVSSKWADDVPLETKKERLRILTEVLNHTSLTWNQSQLGQVQPVLVEAWDPASGWLAGRNEGRIQVRLRPRPEWTEPGRLVGDFVQVRITAVQPLSMEGAAL